MFGNRYFGARMFGDRYFGEGGAGSPPVLGDAEDSRRRSTAFFKWRLKRF